MELFMKLPDRPNSDSFLEMELWRSINSTLPFRGGWAAASHGLQCGPAALEAATQLGRKGWE